MTRPLTALAAAALVGPALVVVATSASAIVGPTTVSEVSGFPIDDLGHITPGSNTLAIPSGGAIGNLMLVAIDTHVVTAINVGSANTTGWHEIVAYSDANAPRNLSLWEGTVNATGSDTLTVTYSGSITSGVYTEISADELTSDTPTTTQWNVVDYGSKEIDSGTTNVTWPTLTSNTTALQSYWGFGSGNGGHPSALPTGFTGMIWGGNSDNETILKNSLATSSPFSPTAPQTSGNSTALGVIISATTTGSFTPPGTPTIGTASNAGATSATVGYTPPVSNGGSTITGYTATAYDVTQGGAGNQTASAASGPITVTGLATGDTYTFTVKAINAIGTSPSSAASNTVVPAGAAPGAPTGVTATAGDAQATVSWTAPVGGTTPTSYTVIPSPPCGGCGGLNTAGLSTTVTGLANGTPYTFTVMSNPGGGTSTPASAPVTPMAPSSGGGGPVATTPSAPVRVSGADRFGTAIAASTAEFPATGSAGAVVLARSDDFPDALVGSPLAKAKNGPLLFASGGVLTPETTAEVQRVLPAGGTVYILGGTAAVPASVATTLTGLGFTVNRLAGADRYATAVMVAGVIGNPGTVLLATGTNFPDALSAGPAAAHLGGAVLLTNGSTMPTAVAAYLAAHPGTVYAVGGPAALADPSATPLTGADRYATAAAVGSLFSSPTLVGIASGVTFPDALTGGAYEAHVGGPLLLTDPALLPSSTSSYLTGAKASILTTDIFGGTTAISAAVQTAIGTALGL